MKMFERYAAVTFIEFVRIKMMVGIYGLSVKNILSILGMLSNLLEICRMMH